MTTADEITADEPVWEMWNPLDPALAEDPYPRYAALRQRDPVYFEPLLGWWFVTGHDEASQVLREPGGELRFEEFQRMRMGRDMSDEQYCRGLRHFVPTVGLDDHRRIRATFKKHFTIKAVRELREQVTAVAHELINAMEPQGRAELMHNFALPLPLATISSLLDIPAEDQEQIAGYLRHFLLAIQMLPMDDDKLAKANASISGLQDHFARVVARRRQNLGDDLLSMLVREADDGVLTEEELIANAWGLYAGGQDTTAASICAAVTMLLENPDELQRLQDDPALLPAAVEEVLRFAGPSQATHRIFDHEITVGGHTIPADTPVILYLIAANRDPRWIEAGEEFNIGCPRPANHLTFSDGKHKCPGSHLARMTVEVALEVLISRLDGLRLDGEVEWDTENLPSLSPRKVPIAWQPRTARTSS
jgi:cytochrome P450